MHPDVQTSPPWFTRVQNTLSALLLGSSFSSAEFLPTASMVRLSQPPLTHSLRVCAFSSLSRGIAVSAG